MSSKKKRYVAYIYIVYVGIIHRGHIVLPMPTSVTVTKLFPSMPPRRRNSRGRFVRNSVPWYRHPYAKLAAASALGGIGSSAIDYFYRRSQPRSTSFKRKRRSVVKRRSVAPARRARKSTAYKAILGGVPARNVGSLASGLPNPKSFKQTELSIGMLKAIAATTIDGSPNVKHQYSTLSNDSALGQCSWTMFSLGTMDSLINAYANHTNLATFTTYLPDANKRLVVDEDMKITLVNASNNQQWYTIFVYDVKDEYTWGNSSAIDYFSDWWENIDATAYNKGTMSYDAPGETAQTQISLLDPNNTPGVNRSWSQQHKQLKKVKISLGPGESYDVRVHLRERLFDPRLFNNKRTKMYNTGDTSDVVPGFTQFVLIKQTGAVCTDTGTGDQISLAPSHSKFVIKRTTRSQLISRKSTINVNTAELPITFTGTAPEQVPQIMGRAPIGKVPLDSM